MEIPISAALKIGERIIKGSSHLDAWYREVESIIRREIIENPILKHKPEVINNLRKKLASNPSDFTKGFITNEGNFIREANIVNFIRKNPELRRLFIQFLMEVEQVEEDFNSYFTNIYISSPTLHKFFNYLKHNKYITKNVWGESFITFEQYYMDKNDINVVSKIALYNGDRVLLLQKTNRKWHLPGGHNKIEETPEEGLKREVKEETGIKNFKYKLEKRIGNLYLYTGKTDICNVKLSEEHVDFKWILPSEVSKYDLTNDTKGYIKYI